MTRTNRFRSLGIVAALWLLSIQVGLTQAEDFQSWTMTSVSKKINSKYTTSLTGIHRFNDNISRFSDSSFDYRLARKIGNRFTTQLIFRHWIFTEGKPIYFFWYDFIYTDKKPYHKWINHLRIHHGLDWVGKEQADYVRWRHHYFRNINKSKLTPFAGYDLWYRLNGQNAFQIIWMEAGVDYKINNLKLRLNARRIGYFNDGPGLRRTIVVTGIFYAL